MSFEGQLGLSPCPLDHAGEPGGAEGRPALRCEHEGRLGLLLTLESPERPQLIPEDLGRSIVTSMATAQVASATNFTTPFSAQTYQVRLTSTLPLWATIGSTAVITANSSAAFIPSNVSEYFAVTSGQVLNFLTTSTSTGYVVVTEMT
jgi:hypothetical protein